jgi:Spy/CpxP family protein refolding chaperone
MKKHPRFLWIAGAAVLMIAGWVVAANAQNARRAQLRAGQGSLRPMFRLMAVLRGLDLTEQQRDQVKTILENHKEDIRTAVREYSKARLALGKALAAGEADLKAVFDKVTQAEWSAIQLRSRIFEEIKGILTPEQLSILQRRLGKIEKLAEAWLDAIE